MDSQDSGREAVFQRVAEVVLGAPLELTADELAQAVGVPLGTLVQIWRALGFADAGPAVQFARTDIELLQLLLGFVDAGRLDFETMLNVVRGLAQTTSKLSDWQLETLAGTLRLDTGNADAEEVAARLAELLPALERMLGRVWRWQLTVALARTLTEVQPGSDGGVQCVGFADIAGFTRLSRGLDERDLAKLVEEFETKAADIVAAGGARLVKTLGDGLMFTADDVDTGVRVAMDLHAWHSVDPSKPALRIGLTSGPVVTLMGDLYGDTVNLASRLTEIARPGATLVDSVTAAGISASTTVQLRKLSPRMVRGFGLIRPFSLIPRPNSREMSARAVRESGAVPDAGAVSEVGAVSEAGEPD